MKIILTVTSIFVIMFNEIVGVANGFISMLNRIIKVLDAFVNYEWNFNPYNYVYNSYDDICAP